MKNTTPSLNKLLVFYEGLFGKPKYVVSCRLIRTQKIPQEVVVLEVRNYKFFLEVQKLQSQKKVQLLAYFLKCFVSVN